MLVRRFSHLKNPFSPETFLTIFCRERCLLLSTWSNFKKLEPAICSFCISYHSLIIPCLNQSWYTPFFRQLSDKPNLRNLDPCQLLGQPGVPTRFPRDGFGSRELKSMRFFPAAVLIRFSESSLISWILTSWLIGWRLIWTVNWHFTNFTILFLWNNFFFHFLTNYNQCQANCIVVNWKNMYVIHIINGWKLYCLYMQCIFECLFH